MTSNYRGSETRHGSHSVVVASVLQGRRRQRQVCPFVVVRQSVRKSARWTDNGTFTHMRTRTSHRLCVSRTLIHALVPVVLAPNHSLILLSAFRGHLDMTSTLDGKKMQHWMFSVHHNNCYWYFRTVVSSPFPPKCRATAIRSRNPRGISNHRKRPLV